ncbi:MAG: hypothetical protein V4681_00985 [Patescibacteria group bacterium]
MSFALALNNEPRFLCWIAHTGIGFNLAGEMKFESLEEIEVFRKKWKNHFFDLGRLTPFELKKKAGM